MQNKTQHAAVKVQLNQKYTQVNVMKTQKDQVEQRLNNLIGKLVTVLIEIYIFQAIVFVEN